jgi:hypothetical protein
LFLAAFLCFEIHAFLMSKLPSLRPQLKLLNAFSGTSNYAPSPEESEASRKAEIDKRRANDPIRALYQTARWKKLRVQLYAERGGRCQCGCNMLTALYQRDATDYLPVAVFDHYPEDARSDPDRFYDPNNIRLLAKPHHDRHTAKTQGFAAKPR